MNILITERGRREVTCLGPVLQIKVFTNCYSQLSWQEIWEAFSNSYPGKWAVQVFPPINNLIDEKPVYHLWVMDYIKPWGLNLN